MTVYTIEGNTSGGSAVVANGDGVFEKSYSWLNGAIDGYGRPNWSLVEQENKSGWVEENDSWRYYSGDTGDCVRNDWLEVDGNWYWFDGSGQMVTNT